MISIARSLVRQIRSVFRRTAGRPPAPFQPTVVFESSADKLRVKLHTLETCAEFQQSGSFAAETLMLPLAALADFEGRDNTAVELENLTGGNVRARWSDTGVPKDKEYEPPELDDHRKFPVEPETLIPNDARIIKALDDAMHCASPESCRFETSKIQLRVAGDIVATDGRQLLLQTGFSFPGARTSLFPVSAPSVAGS